MKVEIGKRLRMFIKHKYGTTIEFATNINLHPNLVSAYINDKSIPGGLLLSRLAELGLNINWLLTGHGEMLIEKPIESMPSSANETMLNRLEIFIKRKGWNKAEFARKMCIHQQHVKRYYTGEADIQKIFVKLSEYGCDLNWLATGNNEYALFNTEKSDSNNCPHCGKLIKFQIIR